MQIQTSEYKFQNLESEISGINVLDSSSSSVMSNASPNKKKLNMDSRGAAIPVDDGFRKVGCNNFKIFGQGKTK